MKGPEGLDDSDATPGYESDARWLSTADVHLEKTDTGYPRATGRTFTMSRIIFIFFLPPFVRSTTFPTR